MMTTRTLSALLAATTLGAVPLLARADYTDAVFEACSHAFIANFTATHGPVAKVHVVPPETKPHLRERYPVSGIYAPPLRYTLFATDPKTGTLLASAECTAKRKAGVSIALLPLPALNSRPLMLSARETE
jgi:hypothetical protein